MMKKCIAKNTKSIWKSIPILLLVTVYALLISCSPKSEVISSADATKELRSAVTLPLERYSPMMSSVPGLPVKVEFPASWTASGYDVIVTCNNGILLSWNPPDYVVKEQGKSFKLSSSSTIYWSPLRMQNMTPDDTLTMALYKDSKEIGKIEVKINANDQGFYNGMMN